MAAHDPTTSRRHVLTGSVALGAAGAVPVDAEAASPAAHINNPDAELIRACIAFDVLERQVQDAQDGPDALADEDEADALVAQLNEKQLVLLDIICAVRAQTVEGNLARLHTLALWLPDDVNSYPPPEGWGWDERLYHALIRDVSLQMDVPDWRRAKWYRRGMV